MAVARRILQVEDDEDILFIARMVLADLGGYDLMQCASGPEALEKAESFAPDVLLLDYMMPGMNGLSTLTALRDIHNIAAVPAIFMTAKSLELSPENVTGLGVIGVITKPFDPVTLPDEIARLLARAGHA